MAVEVEALTDPLWQRRDGDCVQQYVTAIEVTRDAAHQRVLVGDIVAYMDDDDGQRQRPFGRKWSLGQVLAVIKRLHRSGSVEFTLTIRRLLAWPQFRHGLSKADDAALKRACRAPSALLETNETRSIDMDSLLPAEVVLTGQGFAHERVFAPQELAPGTWRLTYFVHGRIDAGRVEVEKDWRGYQMNGQSIPTPLVRGWQALRDAPLMVALQEHYLVSLATLGDVERWRVDLEKEETVDTVVVPRKIAKKKKAASAKKKRPATPTKPASSKRRRVSVEALTEAPVTDLDDPPVTDLDADAAAATASRPVQVQQWVHRLSTRAQSVYHRTLEKPPVDFYTSAVIGMNANKVHPRWRQQLAQEWTVQVGDLVAVEYRDAGNSDVSWHPFCVPWSAGQVLSLHHVEGEPLPQMEIRWFYRPFELKPDILANLPVQVRESLWQGQTDDGVPLDPARIVVEVDEHVVRVPISAVLGTIVTTSLEHPKLHWWNQFVVEGVPQVPVLCRYAYLMQFDESVVRRTNDWTDYGSKLAGPLSRALLCEKAWAGSKCGRNLRKAYKAFLRERFALPDNRLDPGSFSDVVSVAEASDAGPAAVTWPTDLLDAASVVVPRGYQPLYRHDEGPKRRREYLKSVLVSVVPKRCDPRATARKSAADNAQWLLSVGDFCCLANNDAGLRGDYQNDHLRKNHWFPFVAPWSVAQVLAIYRDESGSSRSPAPVLLEVRWMLRQSDLPRHLQKWIPRRAKGSKEEVYESSIVLHDVPASRVLGRVDIFLAHHSDQSSPSVKDDALDVPTAVCRCRFNYSAGRDSLQPLYCSGTTPARWFKWIIERGFKCSRLIKENPRLGQGIGLMFDISVTKGMGCLEALFKSMIDAGPKDGALAHLKPLPPSMAAHDGRQLYLAAPIDPAWDSYLDAEAICVENDRNGLRWLVRLGDVVAVSTGEDFVDPPFAKRWKAAQVIAMYSDRPASGQTTMTLQVRWLERRQASKIDVDSLLESLGGVDVIHSSSLLGPVTVLCSGLTNEAWQSVPTFLPSVCLCYAGLEGDDGHCPRRAMGGMIRRGLELSTEYSSSTMDTLLQAIREEAESATVKGGGVQPPMHLFLEQGGEDSRKSAELPSGNMAQPDGLSSASVARIHELPTPFHVDHGAGLEFFRELTVERPFRFYSEELRSRTARHDAIWTVKVGDPVIVQYSIPGVGKRKESDLYPYLVQWAVAELVTIVKAVDDNANQPDREQDDRVRLELRWFYRASEVRSCLGGKCFEDSASAYEEILESDHYCEVPASSLLAPAALLDSSTAKANNGLSCQTFVCKRLWSYHRKSIIPWASLDGRVDRGRANSKYFGKDVSLRSSLDRLVPSSSSNAPTGAADSFRAVIDKMSLTDASKEVSHDSSAIVGRINERQTIMSFLKTAIIGGRDTVDASLFVAGPPGVGKTACIRAAISDLQREQAAGSLPEFEFIAMNAMEMRQPCEAYVKLWREISGDTCHFSGDEADKLLEAYFCKPDYGAERRVVVVLLDELDYLVTKKQLVLYNFFDWPKTALAKHSPRRLVVVGISNTINLPDHMHPRLQSRMNQSRCLFKAYGAEGTAAILKAKLMAASPQYQVFNGDAITFIAKRTEAQLGDIRKAFRLCRASAEMVLNELEKGNGFKPEVRIKDVVKAGRESFNNARTKATTLCSPYEALVLVALAALKQSTGREFGGFDVEELLTKMESMAGAMGDSQYLPAPTLLETLDIISRLSDAHLVSSRTPKHLSVSYRAMVAGSGGAWPLVSLAMEDNEVYIALKSTSHEELASKYMLRSTF